MVPKTLIWLGVMAPLSWVSADRIVQLNGSVMKGHQQLDVKPKTQHKPPPHTHTQNGSTNNEYTTESSQVPSESAVRALILRGLDGSADLRIRWPHSTVNGSVMKEPQQLHLKTETQHKHGSTNNEYSTGSPPYDP